MATKFDVTPAELISDSQKLNTISNDFLKEVDKMYNALEELMTRWHGAGSSEYCQGALNYKADIQELGKVIGQYDSFLLKASNAYSGTDNSVAGAAGSMFGGRG